MSKANKNGAADGEGAGDDEPRSGPFDDLPYADESPAVQGRPPSGDTARSPAAAGSAPGDRIGATGPGGNPASRRSLDDADDAAGDPDASGLSDEALEEAALLVQNDFVALERERDEYLDDLRRVQADFENYRKRATQQQADHAERATHGLVSELLPVLDACDAALQHGADDVAPVQSQLLDALAKQGLERLHPEGEAFDPNFHDAVMHEAADDADDAGDAVVAEVLRTGYSWKGRVLRPAMVKVKG